VIFVIACSSSLPRPAYQAGLRQIPVRCTRRRPSTGRPVTRFLRITLPSSLHRGHVEHADAGGLAHLLRPVFVLSGGTGGPGTATRVLPLAMYITGFQAHDMGRASAIATLLVVHRTGAFSLHHASGGLHRMDSQQEECEHIVT